SGIRLAADRQLGAAGRHRRGGDTREARLRPGRERDKEGQAAMAKAIIQESKGGPEVMEWRERADPAPGPGEVRLRHTAIGVNFIDVYVRKGAYPLMTLPGTPGMEATGVVEELGEGVSGLAVGQRVGYVMTAPGAYSQ